MASVRKFVAALGFFDSLHLGHMQLIARAKQLAAVQNAEACVYTFGDDFFASLGRATQQVFTLDERLFILKNNNIRAIYAQNTPEILNYDAAEFVDYLADLGFVHLVCGADFRFGRGAIGDVNMLISLAKRKAIGVTIVPAVFDGDERISTSAVRKLLRAGDINSVNRLLGRDYFVRASVARGRGKGNELGISTANITYPASKLLPKFGVYLTHTEVQGRRYASLTSVGGQPTFDLQNIAAETHIIGINEQLYDQIITVYFEEFLRPLVKFSTPDALVLQIKKDIERRKYD